MAATRIKLQDLGFLTTKGDLLGYSTTHGRLGVGANGTALFADSAQTFGYSWRSAVAADISNLGAGVATWLTTPTSANLRTAVATTSTGTGDLVFATSPTLVTPALGTPASGVLTNATGLPTAGLVNDAVTYAKMQNVSATSRVLGRITSGAGDVEELTGANLATIANASFDHNALTNLTTGDVHTHYALLAGRTGTTNNLTLSTTATGSAFGSSASGGGLTLKATSHATAGPISLAGYNFVDYWADDFDTDTNGHSSASAFAFSSNAALTVSTANGVDLGIMRFNGTVAYSVNSGSGGLGAYGWFFAPTLNINTSAYNALGAHPFVNDTTYNVATGITATVNMGSIGAFRDHPQWRVTGTGSYGAGAVYAAFNSVCDIYTGAKVDIRRGFLFVGADFDSGSGLDGTMDQQIAVDVWDGDMVPAVQNTGLQIGTSYDNRFGGPTVIGSLSAPTATFMFDVQGTSRLDGLVTLRPTFTNATANASALIFNPTWTQTDGTTRIISPLNISPAVTYSTGHVAAKYYGIHFAGTQTFATGDAGDAYNGLLIADLLTSAVTSAFPFAGAGIVVANILEATANNVGGPAAWIGNQVADVIRATTSGATITASSHNSYQGGGTIDAVTGATAAVTTWAQFKANNVTLSGAGTKTLTTLIGLDIASLTSGTTNVSIRSAGTATEMRHAGPAMFGINAAPGNIASGSILELERVHTIAGALTDGYAAGLALDPGYTGAFTVTRHNYLDIQDVSVAASAVVTDACVLRFDANPGTHKAVASGTTKTSPSTVSAWMKVNVNGTLYFVPMYTSTTS